jgi:excisionase family DNA binding protein
LKGKIMNTEIYLTPREAAAYLRSSTSTLAKRRLRGNEPKFSRIGRAIRYRKLDLDEFMANTRVGFASTTAPVAEGRAPAIKPKHSTAWER